MNAYENVKFWQKVLGEHLTHKIIMGCGSIFEDHQGNILVSVPSFYKKLDCGCPGQDSFKLENDQLVKIDHNHSNNIAIKRIIKLNYKDSDWANYYLNCPWEKPRSIMNY